MTPEQDAKQGRVSSEAVVTKMMSDEIRDEFEELRKSRLHDRLRFDEPLSRHTSLRIGGQAAIWAEAQELEELVDLCELAKSHSLDVHLVGLGSNALFGDDPLEAVVIRLVGRFAEWEVDEGQSQGAVVRIGAGMVNAHLVRSLLARGWIDAEFLALIPGTFGGAVAMNAGTRDRELASILRDADVLVPAESGDGWMVKTLTTAELAMSYRHCRLPPGGIVVGGRIDVQTGDVDEARERIRFDKERRNETQPYRLASVGSTFANPEGDYAGRLIEAAGLKGTSIGGAQISPLHANFFINAGGATAKDFIALMATARHEVRRQFGVELRPEVQFVGFDGWARMLAYERLLEEQGC
jgi:UDP-N-acetylmuramate dehydrogenase